MTWKINFTKAAEKEFSKLTKNIQLDIRAFLQKKVMMAPRKNGKQLVSLGTIKLWRYRVKDYRIICQIKDKEISVLVVTIAKRDSVYKKIKR